MDSKQTNAIKVGLAEDDADARNILVRLLQKLGYEVACAVSNGAELLDRCRLEEFDVTLVDLDMPVIDGLEAAEEIAQKDIPVILVSGHPDLRNIIINREPIITALSKPISLPALKGAVELALSSRK